MQSNQLKLLNSLAKQIKAEKKDRAAVVVTLQAARILTKAGNFTSNYSNLSRVVKASSKKSGEKAG
jgi:hypothetical protein